MQCLKRLYPLYLATFVIFATPATASAMPNAHLFLQTGYFYSHQGESQHVSIPGLIGDNFSVTEHNDQNGLLGIGYYFDAPSYCYGDLMYGVNGFYLAPTTVKGRVTQEGLFTNLGYNYNVINYPIYVAGKALFHFNSPDWILTLDGGLGGNIITATGFNEYSLDGGVTIPDQIYTSQTTIDWSATIGIGVQVAKLSHKVPLEVGYRFFYLGQGNLKSNTSASNLKTGTMYANALIVSVSF